MYCICSACVHILVPILYIESFGNKRHSAANLRPVLMLKIVLQAP